MPENKTQATDASVADYIDSRASEEQKADCKKLMAIFKRVVKKQPKMWGQSVRAGAAFFGLLADSLGAMFTIAARRVPLRYAIPAAIATIILVGVGMHLVFGWFGVDIQLDGL